MSNIGFSITIIVTAFLAYIGTHCPAFCAIRTFCGALIEGLSHGKAPLVALQFSMVTILVAGVVRIMSWQNAFFFIASFAILYGVATLEAAACFAKP